MTRGVRTMSPSDSVTHAARAMKDLDVGVVPVCNGEKLVGMVTDRDIALRAVAQGLVCEDTRLSATMSADVQWCFEDQQVSEVMAKMGDDQIRRLPVVDRDKRLVGMLSLGDIAVRTDDTKVATALQEISEPAANGRSSLKGS